MKKIPLTQGKVALVDDCDYDYLSQWKWYAGNKSHTFYALRNDHKNGKQKTVYMHRVISQRVGFKQIADHVNRNGLDNRRRNLREATKKQDLENQGLRKDNTSGQRGVNWNKERSKWVAQIQHYGKKIHLGYFEDLKDAVAARKKAERKYFTHA